MSLNPVSANHGWNYSRPEDEGYSLAITGTVVFIQEVQAMKYSMNRQAERQPDFWDNGDPKLNIRIGLAMPDGELKTLTFAKAGAKQKSGEKPSIHMDLFHLTGDTDMMALIGKTITIQTWQANPTTGAPWGNGNPRLWQVSMAAGGPYQLTQPLQAEYKLDQVLYNTAASGGQVTAPAPSTIQVPQPNAGVQPSGVYPAPTAAAPAYQPQPVAVPVTQPVTQPIMAPVPQPMVGQPVAQQQPAGTVQPMQPPVPAGMDPAVAAAMQAVGASNVQPVAQQDDMYGDLPL